MTVLFAIIFKVLPDGKVANRDAFMGAGVTALLFMVGKYVIGLYLGQSNISNVYGAAGSVLILLTWVYYSSMILYLGAELTKVYAIEFGQGVKSASYAVLIKQTEIEATHKDVDTIVK